MKILVVTGKSGGHIFPAVAFIEKLRETAGNSVETLLVLPRTNIIEARQALPLIRVSYLSIRSIRLKSPVDALISIAQFFKGCLESIFVLYVFRPQAVVSFGSLVSVPMVVFARLLGVKKIILHEQNAVPGRAQQFAARFAHRIAISFAETAGFLKKYNFKILLTGNLLRKDLTVVEKNAALKFFSLKEDVFTVLVMGGSQGSRNINTAFIKACRGVSKKSRFQVIHITGGNGCEALKEEYKKLSVDAGVFPFLNRMQYALSCADLVLSRGGATTISELILYRIPAVIVPYPYAYKHQSANAEILEIGGAAMVIRDDELDTELERVLGELITNAEKLKAMKAAYERFPRVDSGMRLVNEVLNL